MVICGVLGVGWGGGTSPGAVPLTSYLHLPPPPPLGVVVPPLFRPREVAWAGLQLWSRSSTATNLNVLLNPKQNRP